MYNSEWNSVNGVCFNFSCDYEISLSSLAGNNDMEWKLCRIWLGLCE